MGLVPPIGLSDEDKLKILQQFDRFRRWRSLEDKRYCLACARIITGREIKVEGNAPDGVLRVVCPTPSCDSIPLDWVLPTSEVLATLASEPPQRSPPVLGEMDASGEDN